MTPRYCSSTLDSNGVYVDRWLQGSVRQHLTPIDCTSTLASYGMYVNRWLQWTLRQHLTPMDSTSIFRLHRQNIPTECASTQDISRLFVKIRLEQAVRQELIKRMGWLIHWMEINQRKSCLILSTLGTQSGCSILECGSLKSRMEFNSRSGRSCTVFSRRERTWKFRTWKFTFGTCSS